MTENLNNHKILHYCGNCTKYRRLETVSIYDSIVDVPEKYCPYFKLSGYVDGLFVMSLTLSECENYKTSKNASIFPVVVEK